MKKIYIVIKRGMLEEVCASEEMDITVIDMDQDGADDDEIKAMESDLAELREEMKNKTLVSLL